MAAFEAITIRASRYAGEALEQYQGVMFGTKGRLYKSDGTSPFAGIIQYGADAAGDMATYVQGAFPVYADGAVAEGDKITFSSDGTFKKAVQGSADVVVCGIALTEAKDKELFTMQILPTTTIVEKSST